MMAITILIPVDKNSHCPHMKHHLSPAQAGSPVFLMFLMHFYDHWCSYQADKRSGGAEKIISNS